jgi:Protein of unknown function (DUF3078)
MNRIFLFCSLLLSSCIVVSQDAVVRKLQVESSRQLKYDIPDTVIKIWKAGGSFGLNVGQGSQSNWAGGGDDFSFTVNSALTLFLVHKSTKNSWENNLSANFGYINTTSLGSRKNDDRFDFLSKYGFSLNKHFNLATLVNFRSQFLKGYTYPNNVKTFASDFLSPAYLVVSQGMDYKPNKYFSFFLSPVTSRWVFVSDTSISAKVDYGVKPGHTSINQNGAFATLGYQKSFNKYFAYKARLDLFSNYKKNPQNIDVFVTNTLSAKIAKILAFSWNVDMIYDDDVRIFGKNDTSPALQFKSIFGVGLQMKI